MSFFSRRQPKDGPKHTFAAVAARSETSAAEPPAVQDEPPADYDTSYDDPGWEDGQHDATSPGSPLPAPDDTMVFRIADPAGGRGYVITSGAPWDREEPDEALPVRERGAAIPPSSVPALRTEGPDLEKLRDLRDALVAWPAKPEPTPGAWLRAISLDGQQDSEPLHGTPDFAGTDVLDDGTPVAGLLLGADDRGTWLLDAVDPAWCRQSAAVLLAMADHLEGAESTEEGEAA